jgi:hypothetical protein
VDEPLIVYKTVSCFSGVNFKFFSDIATRLPLGMSNRHPPENLSAVTGNQLVRVNGLDGVKGYWQPSKKFAGSQRALPTFEKQKMATSRYICIRSMHLR